MATNSSGKVKTSVNLSEDAVQALKDIATSRGTNMSDVLRHAISLEKFVHEETENGAKILVEKNNDTRQLLINP
jgi:predicted transcriptional regulator